MKCVSRAAVAALVVTFGCMSDVVEPAARKPDVAPQFVAIGITAGPQYLSITGFNEGLLEDINNGGTRVGTLRSGGTSRAVFYPSGGPPIVLSPLPGGNQAQAWGINESTDIVGSSTNASGVTNPVFWPGAGAPILLTGGPANRTLNTAASDINENGMIVGFIGSFNGTADVAGLWVNGQFTSLPLPAGAGGAQAHAINDLGDIVGYATFANAQDFRPVLWRAPGYSPQVLPIASGFTGALLRGISNSGVVVGAVSKCCVSLTPAVWLDPSLPPIVVGADWIARDVNEDGTVVGGSNTAWVWSVETGQLTLTTPGATATALNDAGDVVGYHNRGSGFLPTQWRVSSLDADRDGVLDTQDNCPSAPNTDQTDRDGDGIGDACDSCPSDALNDADGDGVCGDVDNCPTVSNSDQADVDGNGIGDACDLTDDDRDGIPDIKDNCRGVFNPDQADADGNGIGDKCDHGDFDRDGLPDHVDNCPTRVNPDQADADGDGIGDKCDRGDFDRDGIPDEKDNCPSAVNPDQRDTDGNGIGDACDAPPDLDQDGVPNGTDNCPRDPNPDQNDVDRDGIGDVCDPFPRDPRNDEDGDGIGGDRDNCPSAPNPDQADRDRDGIGDACDPNQPPVVDAGGPYNGVEGSAIAFTGAATDGEGDALTYTWDFNNDGATDATTRSASHTFFDNGTFTVRFTADDGTHKVQSFATVTVSNVAPVVTALRLPSGPIALGTSANIGVDFTDPGTGDTHTAVVNWEAASNSPLIAAGARTFNGSQTFTQSGVYTVVVTVTDDDGESGNRSSALELTAYIVVFDPSGGFVTGGGWIVSPAGACNTAVCTSATTGKASFGFVSKYHKGANVPTGNTEFHFKAGDLRFSSTSYQWLVVAGMKAKFKGEGTINGGGQYGFMITAVDGKDDNTPDGFRIKIWDIASGIVVYDNKMSSAEDSEDATAIDSGSIVIHK